MIYKFLSGIIILFLSMPSLHAALPNVPTSAYDISMISLSGNQYVFDAIRTNNDIPIKYMLSYDSVFEIQNR